MPLCSAGRTLQIMLLAEQEKGVRKRLTLLVYLSSPFFTDSSVSAEVASANEEDNTLKDLVDLLQNMVRDIPTGQVPVMMSTVLPNVTTTIPAPAPAETVDTVWVNLKPKSGTLQTEPSETNSLTRHVTPSSTTPFWELRNDTSASIVLHTDTTTTTTEEPQISLLPTKEISTTEKKIESFDEFTNGSLSSLEQSLENVKLLSGTLDNFIKKKDLQDGNVEKTREEPKRKPPADILNMIEKLIQTIKNAPSYIKEDPAVPKYVEKAENYIKNALELVGEAEKKLKPENHRSPSTSPPALTSAAMSPPALISAVTSPPALTSAVTSPPALASAVTSPPALTSALTSSPAEPLAKAEETKAEIGKLKAFINLLYGFTPQLTMYSQNSASKSVAEDIVERAMAILNAIKRIFCGHQGRQNKKILKQLLKQDMDLVKQATKAKVAS